MKNQTNLHTSMYTYIHTQSAAENLFTFTFLPAEASPISIYQRALIRTNKFEYIISIDMSEIRIFDWPFSPIFFMSRNGKEIKSKSKQEIVAIHSRLIYFSCFWPSNPITHYIAYITQWHSTQNMYVAQKNKFIKQLP